MNVVYTAPNRAHHYPYALALHKAKILYKFVSGLSRFNVLSKSEELGNKIYRADFIQNFYLASNKFKLPTVISDELAYLAKLEQDFACRRFMSNADIFLFYNGSGLNSCKVIQKNGGIGIVEAVNSHVEFQEDILKDEYDKLKLPWIPFHKKEKARRMEEYSQADFILVPSEFSKKSFLEKGFLKEKLIKVPYGFKSISQETVENLRSELKISSDEFLVLYVGTISVRKGIRYLIEAFKKLNHHKKKLVLVGPIANPSGLDDISLTADIIFTGALKGNELEKFYMAASVFCLPSIEEGFGLVLGEALSYGVPMISTSNTGALDIITDGIEGFIVPPQDSRSICAKLQLLADDKHIRERMKHACYNKAVNLAGWAETGELLSNKLISVYERNI